MCLLATSYLFLVSGTYERIRLVSRRCFQTMKTRLFILILLIIVIVFSGCTVRSSKPLPRNTSSSTGCDPGITNCSGYCYDLMTDDFNCGSCGNWCNRVENESCRQGRCQCEPDSMRCGQSACINLKTDDFNCGSCGYLCLGTHAKCMEGKCQCDPGYTRCPDGWCVDLKHDKLNCGNCSHTCIGRHATCAEGICR